MKEKSVIKHDDNRTNRQSGGVANQHELAVLYERLYQQYGDLDWWPAESPYEVIVGAILTQNTAWSNVEKAIANFPDGHPAPEYVERAKREEIIELIRPAGFFNQKATYLQEITRWYRQYDYSTDIVRQCTIEELRPELLRVKGVGKETAGSILLYAFQFPTFVVDAYTRRLMMRLGYDVPQDYDSIQQFFEQHIPKDVPLYNNYHALIVIHCKEHCKAKPRCDTCPLQASYDLCEGKVSPVQRACSTKQKAGT